ncbi:uncharacterized protein LOC125177914 [Hyalella azteca]|uniref:Uncharacterized protein LOC125177914 n=1 Tax=Hyalella azteca TaxID=294128 RepID=A0A979FJ06_HYAAZ|nr:uncharacterized protein LOC125177914 [Hyalella azteca]
MKVSKYFQEFLMLLVVLERATGLQVSNLFSKVLGTTIDNNCRLALQVPASTKFLGLRGACSLMCMQNKNCRFFCTLKSTGACALYSAYVAVRWPGQVGVTYDACYTSWGDPRDILKTNSPFNFSTNYPTFHDNYIHATDGYSCSEIQNRFGTELRSNSYSQIDLEQITRVQTVIFATANLGFLEDVDVYLSNTSDFTIGEKIGRVDGKPPGWSSITISTNTSVAGRYITFFMAVNNYHGYAEIQIIPLP